MVVALSKLFASPTALCGTCVFTSLCLSLLIYKMGKTTDGGSWGYSRSEDRDSAAMANSCVCPAQGVVLTLQTHPTCGQAQELGTVTPFVVEEGEIRGQRKEPLWSEELGSNPGSISSQTDCGSCGWCGGGGGEEIDSKQSDTHMTLNCHSPQSDLKGEGGGFGFAGLEGSSQGPDLCAETRDAK